MVSVSQQFVPAWAQLQEISIFSLTTGGLRQKQVLTIALFIRPLEMPNPRLLNTSGRGGGSRIGTSCEQTLETGREKPAWIRASMECQPFPMTARDQLLLPGISFVIPLYVTSREKKQELIELWMFGGVSH